MSSTFRIRVDLTDPKEPRWEMMRGDCCLGSMSFIEVVEFAAQASSVLRYQPHTRSGRSGQQPVG